ncbi:chemosensory protein 17 precursor [Tribolium castaneum]|uniref:Chemosensory protein 17 n=1 Tax=Tribolium castaneum TaxID=7070 RepID=Q0MRK6_TRICA|nr:chemosensory protein 17 precursor [Tribolium castaneum]ABH88190.1 chemosensory protein 17 [Tribolium castaneum]EFA07418.1 chemosensory protein 4 [Tribolium castaneum]|eukprot:NP_001039284.1 chemosensory protein 17 precursor [Tribolium castaneum]
MFKVLFVVFACVQAYVYAEEYTVPQNIDIDEILKNDRLTKNYLDCILEKGKCTPEGEELKKDIPDALQNECAKCNEKHKEGVRKVIRHLIKNKPSWWQELQEKYDPKGEYKSRYNHFLEEEGLN